ncbi:ATP-dependent Clp protease ATP-binding subunit [Myxococcus sp. CA033]|uniref:AAA family ATPase n=1 Tax=Myxococcus sp. CA033 TaxID=2741516 RepID=UPI00157B0965|nr:AAA family ATPase [Myxococcus sp. CA033]NTX41426.1 ATP-dependent Clp protease ATP-binding subunit [Myxococcus sp. CA033]
MELKLPLVVAPLGGRLVEAWVPAFWPRIHRVGPSLSSLKDDLALAVMERFEKDHPSRVASYQLPPHLSLKHVKVDTEARDREKGLRVVLKGRMAVLLEKWPRDDFWVVTPTRLAEARFAIPDAESLPLALGRRLGAWCLEHGLTNLEGFWAQGRERLELLEVDAYAPTILPRTPPKPPKPPRRRRTPGKDSKGTATPPETPEQREARRNRRRLTLTELREVARNLSHSARDDGLEHCYGREALVREVVDALEGREGAAIVLVGPPGSGKTALVHEVVRRLTARQDAAGQRRDVWRVDGNQFIAGMMYVGQWEARARGVVKELVEVGDLLYVDDLASLVYAGRTSSERTNVAQFLEPHMARGELTVLAESTPERFERVREEAPTLASLFRVVHVPALEPRTTLPALLGTLRELEGSGEGGPAVRLSPLALETLLDLQQRFVAHEAFPGKAVRLLRRVLARPGTVDQNVRRFTEEDVTAAMRAQTGLPDFVLGSAPPKSRDVLERELAAQVAGQPEAVAAVVDAILTLQRSLQPPDKPLATYLFVGPTGVGKTETAKALARTLFGSEERMVRFDMSEFVSASSITRLLGLPGAPDGELTTALRTQPFCVVLFDEVEKAHPRIFDALLQFLGEGRLTDGAGRTVDARQAVVVLTSNLGVREAAARTGFHRAPEGAEAHYLSSVRAFFRPEFFNRLDRVVPFRSLTPAALRVVVEHALESLLSRRGIRRGNVLVEVESALLDLLVEQAYDPRYGARPLKRALERRLTVPLAHHLVRRGGEDLARVELFRRGEDMGLSVELLMREPAWAREQDPTTWTLPGVSRVLEEVTTRLESLQAAEARRSDGEAPPGGVEAVELGERLERLSAEALDIRENELADRDFLETEERVGKLERDGYQDSWRHNKGRGGLRPRPSYVPEPMPVSPEERLRRCRPKVVNLRDEVEWLAHQLATRARGMEVHALLVEGLADSPTSALDSVVKGLPQGLGRVVVHEEHVEPDGTIGWAAPGSARPAGVRVRRQVVSMAAFGLSEVLATLEGYALVHLGVRPALVRVELLADAPDLMKSVSRAVATRDAVKLAEREARRAGLVPESPQGRVVMEGEPENVVQLRSGRTPSESVAWAARVLRDPARGGH